MDILPELQQIFDKCSLPLTRFAGNVDPGKGLADHRNLFLEWQEKFVSELDQAMATLIHQRPADEYQIKQMAVALYQKFHLMENPQE